LQPQLLQLNGIEGMYGLHLSTITGSSSLITMALFSQYDKTTIPKHPNTLWSERNASKMKWLYILILLFIAMWVLANSHFHGNPFMVYGKIFFHIYSVMAVCDVFVLNFLMWVLFNFYFHSLYVFVLNF
jgi:magnesium-transporting ATPase (P-type)